MNKTNNIFIVAGGTGGHVLPALQLSHEFIKNGYKIIFITDIRMFDFVKKNINDQNIIVLCFKGRGMFKNSLLRNIKSVCLLFFAFIQSLLSVIKYRPLISYGFGGGITIPPLIVSKFFNVPIILHEGNIIIGKANKFLYKYSNVLTTFFPVIDNNSNNVFKYKFIGMPVRKEIEDIHKKKYLIKNSELINILITGGSLGAEVMATQIAKAISSFPKVLKNKVSILQQVRNENYSYVKSLYDNASINYKLDSYIENMAESLRWCHLIICRSGAGTIAENLIAGKPAILIPLLTSADNHQVKNALMIEKIGAAVVIRENELKALDKLTSNLKNIIFNKDALYTMSKIAKKNAILRANKKLVDLGQNIIEGNK
jgi:UDP-N-acetylglucosamine--N-acetylmuramyl-(pentapeptide) pyrophosphoryl-undecaprenol N-acetylglucosamine transferase